MQVCRISFIKFLYDWAWHQNGTLLQSQTCCIQLLQSQTCCIQIATKSDLSYSTLLQTQTCRIQIVTKSDLSYSNCLKLRLFVFNCYNCCIQRTISGDGSGSKRREFPNLILDPHLHQMYISCALQCCLLTEKSLLGTLYKVEKSTWHTLHSRKVYLAQFPSQLQL